jgi:hypothetical protein
MFRRRQAPVDERPAEAAEEAAPEAAPARIAVTNMCRDRPVIFHFRGGSGRLGPLETQEFEAVARASPELTHLAASGTVRVREVPADREQVAASERAS